MQSQVYEELLDSRKVLRHTSTSLGHRIRLVKTKYYKTLGEIKVNFTSVIQPYTQFHIASVRKAYIGFAVAYAVHHRFIASLTGTGYNCPPTAINY